MMHRFVQIVLTGFAGLAGLAAPLPAQDLFETLAVGPTVYTNAQIVNRTSTDVYIRYAGGFANLKVSELPPDALRRLGYQTETESTRSQPINLATLQEDPRFQAVQQELATRVEGSVLQMDQRMVAGLVVACFVVYLFFCYCGLLICRNAGQPPNLLIWIPVLQMFPLLRAARMSLSWFLCFLIPLLVLPLLLLGIPPAVILVAWAVSSILSFIGSILWCLKIAQACGKSPLVGVLLLLPGIGLFAFLYLAFSGQHQEEPAGQPIRLNLSRG